MTNPQSQDQKTTKWFLIGSLIALVLLIGCFSFSWFVMRDDPADVAEQFLEAAWKGDRSAIELICAEERHLLKKDAGEWDPDEDPMERPFTTWKVVSQEVHGDYATVVFEVAIEDQKETFEWKLHLQREDGEWKVCGGGPAGSNRDGY